MVSEKLRGCQPGKQFGQLSTVKAEKKDSPARGPKLEVEVLVTMILPTSNWCMASFSSWS